MREDIQAKFFSMNTYERLFVKPWSREFASIVIAFAFLTFMLTTGAGWGASTPYGMWVGKLFIASGISVEQISEFTTKTVEFFTTPLLQHDVTVQNIGIILGSMYATLMAGKFTTTLKVHPKILVYGAFGGFLIGFATRLANGCNVGALFTPVANLSLSGFIFLPFMIIGGFTGMYIKTRVDQKIDK